MPHKRNPIACENVKRAGARGAQQRAGCALGRRALARAGHLALVVERVVIPDSFILLDYMLGRMTRVVSGLLVYPDAMRENIERSAG